MTKDYKKTKNYDPQSGGYGWMFSGIALGLLIGLGMYFYSNHTASKTNTGTTPASSESSNVDNSTAAGTQEPDPISVVIENARMEQSDRKRASFSYYAVLPNLELDVNVKPSSKDSKPASETSGTEDGEPIEKVVLKPGMHILQIASFKTEAQARRSQKKLKKKGLETRIEKRKIRGKYWYRLFAGPTQQANEISGWKAVVVKSGFKPIVVKVK